MAVQIFQAILEMSFVASVMILVVFVIRGVLKKQMPKTLLLCLWAMVLLKLLVPFSVSSPFSMYNYVDAPSAVVGAPVNMGIEQLGDLPHNNDADSKASTTAVQPQAQPEKAENPVKVLPIKRGVSAQFVFSLIWLFGTGVSFLFFTAAVVVSGKRLQNLKPYHKEWAEGLIKQKVKLFTTEEVTTPLLTGIWNPKIILPGDIDEIGKKQLKYILSHEMAHIRRMDNLWNLVALLAVCIHWFNPLVWVSYGLFKKDIETACDETVLKQYGEKEKGNYAETILSYLKKQKNKVTFVVGFGHTSIKDRVLCIMKFKKAKRTGIIISVALVLVVASVLGTSAIVTGSEKKNKISSQAIHEKTVKMPTTTSTTHMQMETTAAVKPTTMGVANASNVSDKSQILKTEANDGTIFPTSMKIKAASNVYDVKYGGCFAGTVHFMVEFEPRNANAEVTWSSNNAEAIPIDENGRAESLIHGRRAIITAKTNSGLTAQFEIGVFGIGCIEPNRIPQVVGIAGKDKYDNISMQKEESRSFTATITPRDSYIQTIIWSSSDPSAVSVSDNGTITAHKSGSRVLIKATCYNGVYDYVYVNVN